MRLTQKIYSSATEVFTRNEENHIFEKSFIYKLLASFERMPQYGQLSYWTKRYAQDDIPFDWMCGYDELSDTLTPLLWPAVEDPSKSILIAGCGNARFSSDLFYDGYLNIVNIDYCDVVIQQQRSKFPEMDWRVMNALCMDEFEDEKFDFIIDKSLSDTTLCYASGIETTRLLFTEFHRVLKPGGRIIIVSLHSEEDVIELSQISETMVFAVSTGRLPSNREIANRSSSPFHTIAVFDKLTGLTDEEKYSILVQHPISFVNASIRMDEKDRSDDWEGNMELHESGKAIVDDCTSLEELIALYNTVFEEYSQSIESWDDEVNCGKVK